VRKGRERALHLVTVGPKGELAGRVSGHGDADFQPFVGKGSGDFVSPFDERDAASGKVFLRAKSLKVVVTFQPVDIKMVKRAAASVFLAKDKGGTGDFASVNVAGGSDCLNETGFTGSERADQSDNSTIGQGGGECGAESVGVGEAFGIEDEFVHSDVLGRLEAYPTLELMFVASRRERPTSAVWCVLPQAGLLYKAADAREGDA
jgi:hypothetical protein